MTTLNELRTTVPLPPRQIDLVTAPHVKAPDGCIQLMMAIDGQIETFFISRSAAASAIGRIADELAKSP